MAARKSKPGHRRGREMSYTAMFIILVVLAVICYFVGRIVNYYDEKTAEWRKHHFNKSWKFWRRK